MEIRTFKNGEKLPKRIKEEVIDLYIFIFSLPPWEEKWERNEVKEKLEKDFQGENSFLTILEKDGKVVGFSWGKIIKAKEIKERVKRALGIEVNLELNEEEFVLYYDEIAIDPKSRLGLKSLRMVGDPGSRLAEEIGVKKTIFWSSPKSVIVKIVMKILGFKVIKEIDNEIIFLQGKIAKKAKV